MNGKGDRDRSNKEKFCRGYLEIKWGVDMEKPKKRTVREGDRLLRMYDKGYNHAYSDMDIYHKQELEKKADVGRIEGILTGECAVRFERNGIGFICGHSLPCPKHTNINKWYKEKAQAISKMIRED